MKEKSAETRTKRVTIEELLEQSKVINGGRYLSRRGCIKNCKVHEFYSYFIGEREDSKSDIDLAQDWIRSAIKVTLGFDDTKRLTMRELANGISEAVNRRDISREDRWALYELCFLLTAQMSVEGESRLSMEEQTSRQGTPDEEESMSLFRRVTTVKKSREKETEPSSVPEGRVSLSQLLAAVDNKDIVYDGIRKGLPKMKADIFLTLCMNEKLNISTEIPDEQPLRYYDFIRKAERYSGYRWDESISLSMFADRVTRIFVMEMMFRTASRREVMETYELCYEFINLMADDKISEEHVTLMESEATDRSKDMQ